MNGPLRLAAATPATSKPHFPTARSGAAPKLLHPELPYCGGRSPRHVRQEMARTVEDRASARRTRALLLDARATARDGPGGWRL
ncbi:MAG: hypothetical protein R3F31_24785 [Verrucomicrobiales bacterium]